MTVRRTERADFRCRASDLAAHVRTILACRPGYERTAEIETGRLFETTVRPSWWLLETSMQIRLEAKGESTSVSCQTTSQWFILADVFNYYPRYLRGFLEALKKVAGASSAEPVSPEPPSR